MSAVFRVKCKKLSRFMVVKFYEKWDFVVIETLFIIVNRRVYI
jgi:hypothetical protein